MVIGHCRKWEMFRSGVQGLIGKRFSSTFRYKRWEELTTPEKQKFVKSFVENYKEQYPGSKTNVSLKGLALDMDEYNDAPSVFGIFYDDIWRVSKAKKESLYNGKQQMDRSQVIKEHGRFAHETFHDLLIENW